MPRLSALARLEEALSRIADPKGEGSRACLTIYEKSARAAAEAADARAASGTALGPLDGAIVTIKDLFDVAGEPTRAGSKLRVSAPAAMQDAPAVRRLRAAGAVIVAKTNMSEFAFSGIGANPHYGTPGNPADRTRVPGGSSSGAAVSVADGMCDIAIGTDTGGSTRIPAALCGIVGFKPSAWRIPTEGAFPLSSTLDSVGPLAKTVAGCAAADAVMAGEDVEPVKPARLSSVRIGIPQGLPLRDLDTTVSKQFASATKALEKAGARLSDEAFEQLDAMVQVNAIGGFSPAEAYALHREQIEARPGDFDPNVRARIERGKGISAADYIFMRTERARIAREVDARFEDLDILVLPTSPIIAPTIAEVAVPEIFNAKNMLLLRNTSIVNFFDLCAISIPLSREDKLPAGLMLVARNGKDKRLFRIAAAVEQLFRA
ncbi:MAG TPA: amidase [Xanthobacteraceae bacterium]|jgi:aspartyl-tRNA(Asn)/glutamyl-tRNA(Gln) amidotransferase subunit A|nr:amidase [Xanthobacteraceae bacterium]